MTAHYLAAGGTFVQAEKLLLAVLIPVLGLVLIFLGFRRRSAARRDAAGYPASGYPGDVAAAPPRPRSSGIAWIVIGAIVLVLGVAGDVTAVWPSGTKAPFKAGDCFTTAALTRGDRTPTDCANPDAVLQYAAPANSNGECPDGKLDDSVYLSKEFDNNRYCFALNLIQGDCYLQHKSGKAELFEPASCTAAHALKIVKRDDGHNDASQCPSGTKSKTFPEPARTYCAESAKST